jgi:tripartite-type tricarboxylate transporter receptor subunit TctC
MKFEMEFGWVGSEKITVETHDFEKIQVIQEFIQFQEENGWEVEYEAIDELEDEFEEDAAREVIVAGLDSND